MRYSIILTCLLFVSSGYAQEIPGGAKLKFNNISSIAVTNGSYESKLNLQSVFGVSYQKTFGGVGVGIDYYRYRTIPVFVELRQEFGKKSTRFFVYGDGGLNLDWLTTLEKSESFMGITKFKNGAYYDAGIGFKSIFRNNSALLVSTGYNYKEVKKEVGVYGCPFVGPCYQKPEFYLFAMPRLVMRLGFQF